MNPSALRVWVQRSTCLLGDKNASVLAECRKSLLVCTDPKLAETADKELGEAADAFSLGRNLLKKLPFKLLLCWKKPWDNCLSHPFMLPWVYRSVAEEGWFPSAFSRWISDVENASEPEAAPARKGESSTFKSFFARESWMADCPLSLTMAANNFRSLGPWVLRTVQGY